MTSQIKQIAIRNKKTKEYFKSGKGKYLWDTTGAAKNAWNATSRGLDWRNPTFFADQDEWETVEMVAIPITEYESLTEDADWLSCLEDAGVDNWGGISFAYELRGEKGQGD